MIWIPKRNSFYKGRINCLLAFKYLGFQFIVDGSTGRNGWIVDLIPGVGVARNNWINIGFDFRWLIFTFGIYSPTKLFHKGVNEELQMIKNRKKSE